MATKKKTTSRAQVKVKDLKTKKNPKGGLNYTKITFDSADQNVGEGKRVKIDF